jgi:hypothetical protein
MPVKAYQPLLFFIPHVHCIINYWWSDSAPDTYSDMHIVNVFNEVLTSADGWNSNTWQDSMTDDDWVEIPDLLDGKHNPGTYYIGISLFCDIDSYAQVGTSYNWPAHFDVDGTILWR